MSSSWLARLTNSHPEPDDERLLWSKVTGTTEDRAIPQPVQSAGRKSVSYAGQMLFTTEDSSSGETSDLADSPLPALKENQWFGAVPASKPKPKNASGSPKESIEFLERGIVELERGMEELFTEAKNPDFNAKPARLVQLWEDRRTRIMKSSLEMAAVFFSLLLFSFIVIFIHDRYMPDHLKQNSTLLVKVDGIARSVQSSWHGWLGYFGLEHIPMPLPRDLEEAPFVGANEA